MVRPYRIVFVGTRPLAASCLDYLSERVGSEEIKGVLTIPKGTYGWWKGDNKQEVWEVAESKGLPLICENDLTKLDYDLLLCVYWGTIFKDNVLLRPAAGCFNLHTAPLPDYRGCFSYSHAILNGDTHYGSTFHKMARQTDRGDIVNHTRFAIDDCDTARTLYDKTVHHSLPMFADTIEHILAGTYTATSQLDVAQKTGRLPRYYNNQSLEPYFMKPETIPNAAALDRLRRALTFPPKFSPPDWVQEMSTVTEQSKQQPPKLSP